MKKKLLIAVIAIFILSVLVTTLVACDSEIDYVEKLRNKGYKYVTIAVVKDDDGLSYTQVFGMANNDFKDYEDILKETRIGHVFIMDSNEEAKTFCDNMLYSDPSTGLYLETMVSKVKDNIVFYGTEQFLKDVGV